MNLTNNVKIIGLIGIMVIFLLYIFAFRDTTWGGWSPESASLTLDSKEQRWVDNFEKENICKITYIGLDDTFMEDSIIYVNLSCNTNSKLGQKIANEGIKVLKEHCKTFSSSSIKTRSQRYIQFSYQDIKLKENKQALNLKCLYYKDLDSVIKFESE